MSQRIKPVKGWKTKYQPNERQLRRYGEDTPEGYQADFTRVIFDDPAYKLDLNRNQIQAVCEHLATADFSRCKVTVWRRGYKTPKKGTIHYNNLGGIELWADDTKVLTVASKEIQEELYTEEERSQIEEWERKSTMLRQSILDEKSYEERQAEQRERDRQVNKRRDAEREKKIREKLDRREALRQKIEERDAAQRRLAELRGELASLDRESRSVGLALAAVHTKS